MIPDGYPHAEEVGRAEGLSEPSELPSKLGVFGGTAATVLFFDVLSKLIVQRYLNFQHSIEVLGNFFKLTYIHNPGAAFGLHVGPYSRFIFLMLAFVALGVLLLMYRQTDTQDRLRLFAIGAIAGGALGNVLDRIRSAAGVVDFLDFGVGSFRWPVFNLADTAVTVGAVLLLVSLWAEDRRRDAEKRGTN